MHIDENDIARYVDGRITDDERGEIEVHLAECPRCRNQVAAVHQLLEDESGREGGMDFGVREQAEALGGGEAEGRSSDRRMGRRFVAGAAAVVLLTVASLLYWQHQGPPPSRLRSSSTPSHLTVSAPADGATVSSRPVFVCAPVSEALSYRVTLRAPDGTVVWKGDTTAARVPLPPDVSLAEGQTYLWRAEALHSNGTTIRSNLRTFTYAP